SRFHLISTRSAAFCAGVAFDTLTVEPANRSAVPGRGVGEGTAVAGTGVTLVSITRREAFDSGRTLWNALSADKLMDRRGISSTPARTASPTTTSTTSTSPRAA